MCCTPNYVKLFQFSFFLLVLFCSTYVFRRRFYCHTNCVCMCVQYALDYFISIFIQFLLCNTYRCPIFSVSFSQVRQLCTQKFHSFSLSRSLIHFLCSMFAVWITKFCHLRSPFCLSTVQNFCSISWFVLYLLSQVAYLYLFFVCLFCSWFSVGQTFLIATKISCLSK